MGKVCLFIFLYKIRSIQIHILSSNIFFRLDQKLSRESNSNTDDDDDDEDEDADNHKNEKTSLFF